MTQAAPPYQHNPRLAPPPPASNGLGIAGFIVSIVGMVVCLGVLCPIGAVLSLFAVFKRPRGFAIAGLVIGVLGTVLWTLLWWLFIVSARSGMGSINLVFAQSDIDGHYYTHNALPDEATGNSLVGQHYDEWSTAFEYRLVDPQNYEIISAGPDTRFGTTDDVVHPFPAPPSFGGPGGGAAWPGGVIASTDESFASARDVIDRTYGQDFESPAWHEVERLLGDRFLDEWGTPLQYDRGEQDTYQLRSAGPDMLMNTDDDIVRDYTLGEEPEAGPEVDPESQSDAVDDAGDGVEGP